MLIARAAHFVKTVAGLVFRRPLVSVVVIGLDDAGRIALTRRRDNALWSLPGGFLDWGETMEACAARELLEETGLRIVQIDRVVGVYSHIDRDPRIHSVAVVVAAKVVGEIQAADPHETIEAGAFSLAQIERDIGLDRLAFDNGRHMRDFKQGGAPVIA